MVGFEAVANVVILAAEIGVLVTAAILMIVLRRKGGLERALARSVVDRDSRRWLEGASAPWRAHSWPLRRFIR